MFKWISTTVVVLSVMSIGPASAATVSDLTGRVSANAGGGFRSTSVGAQIQPGQRVMVGPNSNVRITFDNGCTVVFAQEGIYSVPDQPTCAGQGPTTTEFAVGTAAAIGVGAGVYLATKSNSSNPASP